MEYSGCYNCSISPGMEFSPKLSGGVFFLSGSSFLEMKVLKILTFYNPRYLNL